jgi:hypothetical protein
MVRQPLPNGGGGGGGGIAHPAKVVSIGPPAANFEHQQQQQQIAESQPMMIELRPNGQVSAAAEFFSDF